MDRREAPPTEEGWFSLHDFRSIDWDAWRGATDDEREAALEEGEAYLESVEAVEDAEAGVSRTYAVNGHKADLLIVHLRPRLDDVNALERRFEHTALAGVTDRSGSYVSVTEVSGYTEAARPFFEEGEVEDRGLENYLRTRLYPTVPDADYVCFYPMDKRRDPDSNWYDLPFDERAEHMARHGEIGREYAGEVTQMITSSIGLDDHEWGVTLWSNDPVAFKRLLYDMRFDPSTSRFAEFGAFYTGQRLEPGDLGALLAGEALGEATGEAPVDAGASIRAELAEAGVYAGQPHGEDVHALVLYAEADPGGLLEAVSDLRSNFDRYDTHEKTAVYADAGGDRAAVVSLWATESAAETAAGFLADLPGVIGRPDDEAGFGTMGLFYTVEPDARDAFVETFDDVLELLESTEGHRETRRFVNAEDENDMFIASRWRDRDDAVAFFRSETFAQTVEWGRTVLADRPRHVFFA